MLFVGLGQPYQVFLLCGGGGTAYNQRHDDCSPLHPDSHMP
jgi:hypothetical protein